MSKHYGGGGGRRMEGKDYPPQTRRGMEDKRPSVFDRLGVRKYEESLPSSHAHPHYHHGGSGNDGGPYRRSDGPSGHRKHSPMNPMMGGRRSQDSRERGRSRSRSFSPRSRKMAPEMPHHHHQQHHGHMGGHDQMRRSSKVRDVSPHLDHRMRQRSTSPMRRKIENLQGLGTRGSSPKWVKDQGVVMPRHKGPGGKGKKSSGKRSGKKGGKEKKSGKGRSSSASSGSSGETSSSSRSISTSSSTTEQSSTSSSNESTSDSSVPSIKLRHDKRKRKKTKKPTSKSESMSTGQVQSRISSGSSIDSSNIRDNRDLREKIKAKTRQNYERMHDETPPDFKHRRPPPDQYGSGSSSRYKQDMRAESPGVGDKRRRPSGASSFEDKSYNKRRRVLSPEEFAPSPRRAPPPNDAPVGGRRERSPSSRDRFRVIQSPMRRAPVEDGRRDEVRSDISKRLDNFGDKSRDIDRYREEVPFGRDNLRQKERLAPARSHSNRQHPGSQMGSSDQDRSMIDRPGGNRYDHTIQTRPLLLLPHGSSIDQQKQPQPSPYKSNPEDRIFRTSINTPSPSPQKHAPMIVKSKEALIEKYRGMKQSQYVDMWVDKTVEACASPGSNIISPPPKEPTSSCSAHLNRPTDDSTEPVSTNKAASIKDIEDMLSDFSDDAEEIFNDDVEGKSEKSIKDNSSSVADKEKKAEYEAEVASTVTTETNDKKQTAQATAGPTPTSVMSSSNDKKLGTPQRSFLDAYREGPSLASRSQTEDDILERMDFEEISDEELGDVSRENKIPIVDALGVDWASLVCGEKNRAVSPSSVLSASSTPSMMKVRKRWTPLQVLSRVGVTKNCSERLLQKIVEMKMKEEPYEEALAEGEDIMDIQEKIQDELQNAAKFRKTRARAHVINTIGLGPNSRALSSRRDMALRRYYLGMPQKSLVSMDMLQQNPSTCVQDFEAIGELYRLSLSLFKNSDSQNITV